MKDCGIVGFLPRAEVLKPGQGTVSLSGFLWPDRENEERERECRGRERERERERESVERERGREERERV